MSDLRSRAEQVLSDLRGVDTIASLGASQLIRDLLQAVTEADQARERLTQEISAGVLVFHGGTGGSCPGKLSINAPRYVSTGQSIQTATGVVHDCVCEGCGAGLEIYLPTLAATATKGTP